MDNLRTQLAHWIVREIATTLESSYSKQLSDDVSEMLRTYMAGLRGDQVLIRMASEIRKAQVAREKSLEADSLLIAEVNRESNDTIGG